MPIRELDIRSERGFEPVEGTGRMPSTEGLPAGMFPRGMGFISLQSQGGEVQLFLPTHGGSRDLPFPRQKLLVMSCLVPLQGAFPGARKGQDVSSKVAEREHPAAVREGEPDEGSLEEEPRDCHDTVLSSVLIVRLGPNLAWCNSAEVTRD